jgi:hypothetical protein
VVVAFVAALAVGMTTKSSSSPQPATSLARPISIQAPQASVAALARAVPTPGLKPRTPPVKHQQAPAHTGPVAPSPSTASAPPPSAPVIQSPPPGVTHNTTGGVVHSPSGVVHSSGGGSGVVRSGN